jgi:hypothetical protein
MDRALARTPQDRYASAAEFARDVRGVASTLTGQVDVEAGTQQVGAIRFSGQGTVTPPGTVPATRIDPAVKDRPSASPPSRTMAGSAAVVRPKKSLPLIPIAVGVVLLAGVGGVLVVKGMGGNDQPDPTGRDTSQVAIGNKPLINRDSIAAKNRADSIQAARDSIERLSHQTKPINPGNLGRDSATKPTGTVPAGNPAELPTVQEATSDDPAIRSVARQKALRVYFRRESSDSLKASAALRVMGTYTEDQRYKSALDWADSSYRFRADPQVLKQIDVLKQLLGN